MAYLELFYCYESADRRLFLQLTRHLKSLLDEFHISTWSVSDSIPGRDRENEIEAHLKKADIILLLISAAFVASEYPWLKKIEHILLGDKERYVHVIPILLSPVNWNSSTLSRLNSLPNNKPVTLWAQRDQAFRNIVDGIRIYLESQRGVPFQTPGLRVQETAPIDKAVLPDESELPEMKHYLYISDTKVEYRMLQIMRPEKEIPSSQNRLTSLNDVLSVLRKKRKIKPIDNSGAFHVNDYISGVCPMRWGVVSWGRSGDLKRVCFFFAPTPAGILLLAGSAQHLTSSNRRPVEYPLQIESASGSDLPGMFGAIEFAAKQSKIQWSDGISDRSPDDYLGALAFVQGKFFYQMKMMDLVTPFPEQMIEFTALVLKTLPPPSKQQLSLFIMDNHIDEREQGEIQQMMRGAQDILLCTPLYTALG